MGNFPLLQEIARATAVQKAKVRELARLEAEQLQTVQRLAEQRLVAHAEQQPPLGALQPGGRECALRQLPRPAAAPTGRQRRRPQHEAIPRRRLVSPESAALNAQAAAGFAQLLASSSKAHSDLAAARAALCRERGRAEREREAAQKRVEALQSEVLEVQAAAFDMLQMAEEEGLLPSIRPAGD